MAAIMTEEEANALDELYTKKIPPIRIGVGGLLTRQRDLLRSLDEVAANYLITKATSTNKTVSQLIGELVREKINSDIPEPAILGK
ncbi:MAG: hypothetical protein Ta2F_00290 [Termitinemataceae bacterium]|nr:MAG: hypothetical protein Ta2F_00290 [Termitinemataceae bacterium]